MTQLAEVATRWHPHGIAQTTFSERPDIVLGQNWYEALIANRLPPLESLTQQDIDMRVAAMTVYARQNSPFYREHLRNMMVPRNVGDLQALPVLPKHRMSDLNSSVEGNTMLTRNPSGALLHLSGGTTAHQTLSIRDWAEYSNVTSAGADMLAARFQPGDRVANLLGQFSMWSGFPSMYMLYGAVPGVTELPIGSYTPEQLINAFDRFDPNAATCLPIGMFEAAKVMDEAGLAGRYKLDRIEFGGAPLYPAQRQYIERVFGGPKQYIEWISMYSSTETGVMALSLDPEKPHYLTVANNNVVIEILDNEGNVVPEGEAGAVTITHLNYSLVPMIRYQNGDRARLVPDSEYPHEARRLNKALQVMQLLGRTDDVMNVSGLKIDGSALRDELLAKLKEQTGIAGSGLQFQLSLDPATNQEVFRAVVEAQGTTGQEALGDRDLMREVLHEFCKNYPVGAREGDPDIFASTVLDLQLVEELERTGVGKVKPVIDTRM